MISSSASVVNIMVMMMEGRMLLDGGDTFALASPASLAFSASLTHLQMQ